jgi:hypothetical protein
MRGAVFDLAMERRPLRGSRSQLEMRAQERSSQLGHELFLRGTLIDPLLAAEIP